MVQAAVQADELETHRDDLRALARARLARGRWNRLDPDDLVQQTFLRACQHRDACRGETPAQVGAWLRSILIRLLIDHLRRPGGADAGASLGPGNAPADGGTTPSQRASRKERNLLLAAAVARLPPDQRQAVELRHLRGHSLDEVADRMGRTGPAVAGLLRRGLLTLRADLAWLE